MPAGDCQHSGTYNGHVVAVAAGLAAVTVFKRQASIRIFSASPNVSAAA